MRTIEKAIRTAHIEKKNWKQALYQFLRQYRATPHTTTNVSPSEVLNNRKLKMPLPSIQKLSNKKPKIQCENEIKKRKKRRRNTQIIDNTKKQLI
jgi:hypothetical protein